MENHKIIINPIINNSISITTPVDAFHTLKVLSLNGRLCKTVFNNNLKTGTHRFLLNDHEFAKGIFIINVESKNLKTAKKIVIK